jgi:dTDP-4-amino-4,6-dideoxygalactose transaminase
MDPIMALAAESGFKVIEDCAQAHGARYKGRSVGSIGHIGAWSFCQDKIMTTGGEGGMVTVNDEALWRSMWAYKDHGKSYAAVYERQHAPGFRWLHESFGTNWRMLEMQAVIGRLQLKQIRAWTARRAKNAEALLAVCRSFDSVRAPVVPKDHVHAWYKCYVYVVPSRLKSGWNRDRIVSEMNAQGVPCYQGSCSEVYRERAFDGTLWRPKGPLSVASKLGENSLMFLVHPTLTDAEIVKASMQLRAVLTEASA